MKQLKHITAFILMLAITSTIFIWETLESEQRYQKEINGLKNQIESKDKTITTLKSQLAERDKEIAETEKALDKLFKQLDDLFKTIDESVIIPDAKVSRGETKAQRMRVTAYDLSYESCGKLPGHPGYGITASGEKVQEWQTCAAGSELKFGTKVYIPFFKNQSNKGIFIVTDRGSGIKKNCIDVYISDYQKCIEFGVKELEVYVIGGE